MVAIKSRLLKQRYSTIPQPMSELNITPLIDVLLVLIVMLILSIPITTNKIEVDLPNDRVTGAETQQVALSLTRAGAVLWNGEQIDRAKLQSRLAEAAASPMEPVIRFHPDANTSYNDAVQVIHLVGEADITRFAFTDTHEHRTFTTE